MRARGSRRGTAAILAVLLGVVACGGGSSAPPPMTCGARVTQDVTYAEDARGLDGDPVAVVREELADHLRADDEVVSLAGSADGGGPQVAVVRDGQTIAVATVPEFPNGGRRITTLERCDGIPW
jgi:hypothetical protein